MDQQQTQSPAASTEKHPLLFTHAADDKYDIVVRPSEVVSVIRQGNVASSDGTFIYNLTLRSGHGVNVFSTLSTVDLSKLLGLID